MMSSMTDTQQGCCSAAADAGLKTLRLLKLSEHMDALSRENMMDFLYTVGMVRTAESTQHCSCRLSLNAQTLLWHAHSCKQRASSTP
jgi:hypothetical protein